MMSTKNINSQFKKSKNRTGETSDNGEGKLQKESWSRGTDLWENKTL